MFGNRVLIGIRTWTGLLQGHVQHARWTSSAAYRWVAPLEPLKESYVHCPGVHAFTSDTLGTVLDRAAVDHCSQEAIVCVHQNIRRTWAEVGQEADRLAAGLVSLGLQRGDRVAIWATNSYQWQLTQYAAAKAGLVLVTVNQANQTAELEHCLKKAGVSTLVAADGYRSSDYYSMLTELLPELADGEVNVPLKLRSQRLPQLRNIVSISHQRKRGVVRFDDLLDGVQDSDRVRRAEQQAMVDCDDACSILFTSGTTGLPKGAAQSHHSLINGMLCQGARIGLGAGAERICVPVPLYHVIGCVLGSVLAPLCGHTLVFPSPTFCAAATIRAIQDERCSWVFGTPTMYVDMANLPSLVEHDVSSLQTAVVGGATIPLHHLENMVNKLGLQETVVIYGSTESLIQSTANFSSDDLDYNHGSVGFPTDHIELKVVDEAGRIVRPGTPGQLCTRGYNTMMGYWEEPQKTEETFSAGRWLLTGDIAVMEEDCSISIVGRSKDMVIRGGENIYPAEVENLLSTHPNILEAHVIYGSTESLIQSTANFSSDDLDYNHGSVGFPTDHIELKVVDEAGRIVRPGTPGQLCTRGYNTMMGYWEEPQKTEETFSAGRWLLTGDIAVMEEDCSISIVGRSKDMVIRGGENIYPAEVENLLSTHPNILEAHVFGVPDDRMGEEVCVWIRSDQPGSISEDDVRTFCTGKIAHFKIPRYIQFRDDFPKTVSGKVQKFVMRQIMTKEMEKSS